MMVDTDQLAGAYDQDLDTLGLSLKSIVRKVTGAVGKIAQPVLGIVQSVAGGTIVGTAAGVLSNVIGGGSSPAPPPPPPPPPVPAQQPSSAGPLLMVGVGVAALFLLSRRSAR